VLSILTADNCYEELSRNFKEVLYNTVTLFQATQLVINTDMTNIARLITAIFPYCPLHMTFSKYFPVEKRGNIFRAPILQSNFIKEPNKLSIT